VIPGHEGAGIVESIGEGVSSVAVGDHVIILWLTQCDSCTVCTKKPMGNICQSANFFEALLRKDGTSRITLAKDGRQVLTHLGTATFAEYTILPAKNVCKIPESIPFDMAALFGCCVGTGYGSVRNIAKVPPGSVCAVWGLGAVGLCTVIGCKAAGASKIIAIDTNPEKFGLARELGATECLNPLETGADLLGNVRGEDGLDFAFECAGVPVCMEQALKALALWGTLVIVGLQATGTEIAGNVDNLLMGQTIAGGYYGRYKPLEGIRVISKEFQEGRLDSVQKLVTHRFPLDEINEGFKLLEEGRCIRTVIQM